MPPTWVLGCLIAALTVALVIGLKAHAEPADGSDRAIARPEISDLVAARLLMKVGRFEHARAFLEQWRPSSEEGRIERLFLLGRVELELGMPKHAAERFEAILAYCSRR